jgi:alpha-mannosidase
VRVEARLSSGSPRLDVTVTVDNHARDHRLRVLLPGAGGPAAAVRADSAFALVERGAGAAPCPQGAREDPVATAPMLTVVDAGDGSHGLTVYVDGLTEYELVDGGAPAVAVTLLRCVGFLSRDDLATRRGHAGPGLPTPGAQCAGTHTFRFAVEPRGAPPTAATLFAGARAYLSPPRLFAHAGGGGTLPARGSFLESEGDVVLSACYRAAGEDAVTLRAFNPAPRAAAWRVQGAARSLAAGRIESVEVR